MGHYKKVVGTSCSAYLSRGLALGALVNIWIGGNYLWYVRLAHVKQVIMRVDMAIVPTDLSFRKPLLKEFEAIRAPRYDLSVFIGRELHH